MDPSSKCLFRLPWNLYRHFAAIICFGMELPRYIWPDAWRIESFLFWCIEVETHYAERLYQCFSPSTFLPCSKRQERIQCNSARRPTTKDQISLCSLGSFPSDTNRHVCFYPIYYTSSCLSNHITSYLSIPLYPPGLPLFCLWDLMLPSLKKFCFMQLLSGKHTLYLCTAEAFIMFLTCSSACISQRSQLAPLVSTSSHLLSPTRWATTPFWPGKPLSNF